MFRFAGCILILMGCTTAGFLKSMSYRERTAELQNIIEIIKLMQVEILYRKDPLIKSFHKVSQMKKCWFSEVLQNCSCLLAEHRTLREAWRSAMDEKKTCPLHKKDIDVINDMVLGLGQSDAEGQQRIIEAAAIRLKGCLEEAENEEISKGRMYFGIGAAAGIVAAIILI